MNKIALLLLAFFVLSLSFCKSSPTGPPPAPTPPSIAYFNANPSTIVLESSSELSWSVSNATKVEIDQGIGQVALSGSKSVSPSDMTTYTLTAHNGNLTDTKICVVTVEWKPFIVYATDTGSKYHRGDCSYLSQSKNQSTLGEACQKGLTPCSVCQPPSCR